MRRIPLLAALMAALAVIGSSRSSAQDGAAASSPGSRVEGRAYSSTDVPPVIDDPSDAFLEDADPRDGGLAAAYTGLDDYDLKNGAQDDNKKRWATTDFIRWLAQGPTLIATGQVHDSDAAATSEVSSDAWGALKIDVVVTKDEGDVGEISAENTILFSYVYDISGPRILDAKVLLSGTCVDIHGKTHSFSLSDVRSESVTERVGITRMRVSRHKTGAKVQAGAGVRGGTRGGGGSASVGASLEAVQEVEASDIINTSIERSLPGAGGGTGTESGPLVKDSVSGGTTLKKSYAIYSKGSVVLAARGSEQGTTVVLLKKFTVQNSLKVFKKAERLRSPTDAVPGDGSGAAGEGATSGVGAGGVDSGVPTEGAAGTGAGGADSSGAQNTGQNSGADTQSNSLPLDGVQGLDGIMLRLSAIAPRGLAEEPGNTPGELHLVLSEPAPRDLRFSVVTEPAGILSFLQGATITIPAGSRFVGGSLEALQADWAAISVHLLDANDQLTGREVAVQLECSSSAQRSEPELYACGDGDAWHAGVGTTIFGIRGQGVPALVIGRLGFADYDSTPTSVSITVEDPDGILPPLSAAVTIPAADAEVRVELPLQDVAGIATLTLSAGESTIEVYVVSRSQGWAALPLIRIPVGATAVVPFQLLWPESTGREVIAVAVEAAVACPIEGGESVYLVAGATLEAATIRGVSVGRTVIRYETEGLPALDAIVEVVPARVSFASSAGSPPVGPSPGGAAGQLRLSNLPTGTSGTIELTAPDGAVFAEVTIPSEASSFLSVTGMGTGRMTLRLLPSPDVPGILSLGLRLDGIENGPGGLSTAGPVVLDVTEDLEEDSPLPVRNSYRIEAD